VNRRNLLPVIAAFGVGAVAATLLPVSAQNSSSGDVMYRLQRMEERLARMEYSLNTLRQKNGLQNTRWQKIRDNGQTIIMLDTQTGKAKAIDTIGKKSKDL
jgi:hypothetical protein